MSSQIDFAMAVGMFIVFMAVLILYLTGNMSSYTGLVSSSEMRTVARNIFNILFGGKGVPKNWNEMNITPAVTGLLTDLYRIPLMVGETSGIDKGNVTINATISFDFSCENKAWNSTVRVLEGEVEIPSHLYNQTFCTSNFLNSSDITFAANFSAYQKKFFFIYFSGEKSVAPLSYSLAFSNPSDFYLKIFPEEKFSAVSASKILALRNYTYEELLRTLEPEYDFNLEVSAD